MKYILTLLLTTFSLIAVSQNNSMAFNLGYRTEYENIQLGVQVKLPMSNHFLFSPSLDYYLKKYWFSSLELSTNMHYAIYTKNKKSSISPFVGIGGRLGFYKGSFSQISYEQHWQSGWSTNVPVEKQYGVNSTEIDLLVHFGLAGEVNMGKNTFINMQAKYSLVPTVRHSSNYYTFTIGYGFRF